MFKSAATKIAHNSTLPALAINQDLRPLQDLITAEKAVIISLQRLATDLSKAAESLKAWGLGEGDDLGDILTASSTILTHFTSALSEYASHGHYMREQLKAIRTREENLDELKRRRRTVNSKADAAEKKLSRMNPEHKNFVSQTELLNKLRDEIRGLDVDIMKDEAAIGDFKRSATRLWVGLKFGGLIECCEKGVIAGEYGKLVVSEIPNDQTQPGLPRNPYLSHSRIGDLVAEAHRCVNEVRLSTVPSTTPQPLQQQLPQVPHVSDSPFMTQGAAFSPSPYQPQPRFAEQYGDDPSRPNWDQHSPIDNPTSQPHYSGSLSNAGLPSSLSGRRVDEFGNSLGPADAGARFATFPVKPRSGVETGQFSLIATPTPPDHGQSDSFASSVAQALAATTSQHDEPPVDPSPLPTPGRFSKDGPAPSYEASVVDKPSPPGPSMQQSEQRIVEEEDGRHVRFAPGDSVPREEVETSVGRGPQARLARLLQNEDEDENDVSYERSLDAAAAREVGVELHAPNHNTDGQQLQQQHAPLPPAHSSPQGSIPSSPVRGADLERAPTYTEKPTLYHNQYGTSPSPPAEQQPPQQQQQQYYQGYSGVSASPRQSSAYSYGYHDSPQQQQQLPAPDIYAQQQQQQQPLVSSPAGNLYQQQQQQQQQQPQGGGMGAGHGDERGQEADFYNPYAEHQDHAGSASPSISSPLPPQLSLSFPNSTREDNKGYATTTPPVQGSRSPSISISGGGGDEGRTQRSPVYERPPNAPYMMAKPSSNSSLNSSATGGGGGGKISAAAFKRPSPRIGSNSGSPFASAMTTPIVPPGAVPSAVMMNPTTSPLRIGKKQQQQGEGEGEGQYDYIGAYVNEGENDNENENGGVGPGVGTYYYGGLGGGGPPGQGKFESK